MKKKEWKNKILHPHYACNLFFFFKFINIQLLTNVTSNFRLPHFGISFYFLPFLFRTLLLSPHSIHTAPFLPSSSFVCIISSYLGIAVDERNLLFLLNRWCVDAMSDVLRWPRIRWPRRELSNIDWREFVGYFMTAPYRVTCSRKGHKCSPRLHSK